MIEMIERKICDVCHKEVERFSGSLVLDYMDRDYTGNGCPVRVERKEICINCCRKLDDVLTAAIKDM